MGELTKKVQLDILVAPLEARQRIAETGLGQGREIVRQARYSSPTKRPDNACAWSRNRPMASNIVREASSTRRPLAVSRKPPLAALAEPVAEALLQAGDVHADVRLAHVQLGLGRGETAALHHAGEDAQQTQV